MAPLAPIILASSGFGDILYAYPDKMSPLHEPSIISRGESKGMAYLPVLAFPLFALFCPFVSALSTLREGYWHSGIRFGGARPD
jgi:hypothetical protein